MTPLRLVPRVPVPSQAEVRANRLALLGVAIEVRRELLWGRSLSPESPWSTNSLDRGPLVSRVACKKERIASKYGRP